MKNLTWQNPGQLFVAQELIKIVKLKCCGIKVYYNSDGTIDEKKTYTDYYYKQLHKDDDDESKDKKDKKAKSSKEKEGCLTKLWKAPFRLLWWLIKKALVILSLGVLSGLLNGDDDKN